MKAKLVTVLVAIALIFIGAVLWRTDGLVFGDRMNWVEALTRTQINSVNRSVLTELQAQQKVITSISAENMQKGRLPWSSLAPYYAVATFSIQGQTLTPQIFLTKENSRASQWTLEFLQKAIGPLAGRTSDMRYYVKSFQDAQKNRYVAVLFLEGQRAYGLFGSGENFQSIIDSQKGSAIEFSVVNQGGLTIGHSVPDYVGTVLSDNNLLQEARSSGASFGTKKYSQNSGDEIYGSYELIPQSNLVVISSAPMKAFAQGRGSLWTQILLLGLGLVLVGVAAIMLIVVPSERQMVEMKEQMDLLKTKTISAVMPQVSEKAVAQDPEQTQKEKLEASIKVASALAHEMSGPLTSIMGHSQMILATEPAPNVVETVESILRETRGAKGVLNKLLGFAGEGVQDKKALRIEAPLVKILRDLDSLLRQKGVKVQKDLQSTNQLQLNAEAISMALTHVLNNSIEAMERMSSKALTIRSYDSDEGTHLEIKDTGEGIEASHIEKIFDPFFTTRPFQNHMGLGLSLAFGILKEHNAELKVESQRGQGTQIFILFKKVGDMTVTPSALRKKEEIVVAPDLPQLKEDSAARVEAQAIYEQVKEEQKGQPTSPLDINIDSLLDLPDSPDAVELKAVADASAQAPTSEELEQISSRALDDISLQSAIADFNEDETRVEFVNPPQILESPKQDSKLDSYRVQIRRPGKRP